MSDIERFKAVGIIRKVHDSPVTYLSKQALADRLSRDLDRAVTVSNVSSLLELAGLAAGETEFNETKVIKTPSGPKQTREVESLKQSLEELRAVCRELTKRIESLEFFNGGKNGKQKELTTR